MSATAENPPPEKTTPFITVFDSSPNARKIYDARVRRIVDRAIMDGAIAGLTVFTAATALSLAGHRYWPAYRAMTLPGKAMIVTIFSVGGAMFVTENNVTRYALEEKGVNFNEPGEVRQASYLQTRRYQFAAGALAAVAGLAVFSTIRHKRAQHLHISGSDIFMRTRLITQGTAIASLIGMFMYPRLAEQWGFSQVKEKDEK